MQVGKHGWRLTAAKVSLCLGVAGCVTHRRLSSYATHRGSSGLVVAAVAVSAVACFLLCWSFMGCRLALLNPPAAAVVVAAERLVAMRTNAEGFTGGEWQQELQHRKRFRQEAGRCRGVPI